MSRRHITVEADAYLEDFDDDDLVEELKERGYYVSKTPSVPEIEIAAERAYYALNDTVPPPVREFILQAAGRVN